MRARRFLPVFALSAVLAMTGCSSAPPPVSDKVQAYYDANKGQAPVMPSTEPASADGVTGDGMLGSIQAAVTGPNDAVGSVLGDSTGNGPEEWVALWSQHLTKYGTVTLHMWNQDTSDWNPEPRVYPGGSKQVTIWNGSQPGSTYTYPLERLDMMQPEKPSFTILSFGHNMAAKSADVGSAELLAAVDKKWGVVLPAAVTLQNPAQGEREPRTASSVNAITAWAPIAGYPTINVNKAIHDAGPVASFLQDDVHPNPAGSQIWADTVATTLG